MLTEPYNKLILDICGGSGAWSEHYKNAGYDVRNITLPDYDILTYVNNEISKIVYGILFALPCTHFSGSGARWWAEKDQDGRTLEDTKILTAGLIMIAKYSPHFWCIENPVGRLNKWLGNPVMYFNPCDYGDPYTKKTALWGKFNAPEKCPIEPYQGSKIHLYPPSTNRAALRGITPSCFAQAFFEANQ